MRLTLLITILFVGSYCSLTQANKSQCYGTTAQGRIEHSVKLPAKGTNFVSYSGLAGALGRTYVHADVAKIMLAAYGSLALSHPNKVYKYAETGLKHGGKFKPHKTHQNGLSVDFMVPVTNPRGESVHLPTHAFNRLGYDIEFDNNSQYKNLSIDYPAMAAHLVTLDKAAKQRGFKLTRVIFDPQLQPELFKTPHGAYLKQHIVFSTKRAWVRHDEHYHVDFAIPCKP
ncbi:penicillin-insensitive murein endopeptidase [Saccharophagus degradans]|uniref:penicillin-insensitive murein endopeptidase n=1 Tax=Saccharophagus degradans TaxID=86304 RepID=UPI001C0A618F|nr:penicillin-insensitive murein endopeptidase [Saccharophagus degradans]MBU2985087.1 penicillin-insensitive murein endopeptidase [Saccharophagus degradans]